MLLKLFAKKEAFMRSEEGATAIEYGLIAAGIALAILGAVQLFGTNLTGLFDAASEAVQVEGDTP